MFAGGLLVNGIKVLIAEDEYIVALDLKNILTKAGYTIVSSCSRCEDVIHQAKLKKPDLLIFDYELKGKLSAAEACNNIYSFLPIPIIFLSSIAGRQAEKLLDKFVCEVILKPFQEDLLLSTIKNLLKKPA